VHALIVAVAVLGGLVTLLLVVAIGEAVDDAKLRRRIKVQDADLDAFRSLIAVLEKRPTVEQFEARDREIRRLRNQLAERARGSRYNGAVIGRHQEHFGA
jgi:hypothetical protein